MTLECIAADAIAELMRLPCRKIDAGYDAKMHTECPKCSAILRYQAWLDEQKKVNHE